MHDTLEKEPDPVRKEKRSRTSHNNESFQLLLPLIVSLNVKRAQLRDKELQIVPELALEVGVHSTAL